MQKQVLTITLIFIAIHLITQVIPLKREIAVTYQTVIWCGYSTFVMGLMEWS